MNKIVLVLTVLMSFALANSVTFAQSGAKPCDQEPYRAFDFWLGEWRVSNPNGDHAGDSVITLAQDGCVIVENWRSAKSDYTGTSYNSFNAETSEWEQLWLDNKGGRLKLRGVRDANQMILKTDSKPNAEGKEQHNRIAWSKNADGSVRQVWTVVTEGGEDSIAFDGLYVQAKPAVDTE